MPFKDNIAKREYQRLWIESRRQEWIEENGPCKVCGTWDKLDVDHIDPSTKLYKVSSLWSLSKTNPKRVNELAKCQVLCEPCHKKKTEQENGYNIPVHGTRHAYMHFGCRCTPCKISASEIRERNRNSARLA